MQDFAGKYNTMQNKFKKNCLKNGLTKDQVIKARQVLNQVNVSAICEEKKIKISTIYNVLRDESPHVDKLKIVLDAATKQVKEKNKTLKSIPA